MTKTLAERLERLFKTFRRKDGKEYTYKDIEAGTGKAVTAPYVWKLRTGEAKNPSIRILRALSEFFGVPMTYFVEDTSEEELANLKLAAELRDPNVARIALRARDLDEDGQRAILEMIEYVRKAQGLDKE
jgi:transcriptional regulator with XRE-family HTH domain